MNTRTVAVLASSLLAIIGFFVSCTESYAATGWWNVGGIPGVTTVEPYNESKNRSFAVSSTWVIYAALSDVSYASGATVKKLVGDVWTTVGAPGFSSGAIYNPIIKVAPDGVPYVAYVDAVNGYVTMVKKFNGSSWVDVGSASIVDPDRSGAPAPMVTRVDAAVRDFAIAPDGTPYLAINDSRGEEWNVGRLAILRYQSDAWEPIGGIYDSDVSSGTTYMNDGYSAWPTLAFTSDSTPYVGFEDYGDGATHGGTIQVKKYVLGSWTNVGPANISDGYYNDHMSFTIGPDDVLYIAYADSSTSWRTIVKKWNGSSWVQMGGYLTTGGSLLIGLLATQEGKVYVRMSDVANGYKTYVHVFDGTSWTNTVSGNFPSGTVGRSTMFRDPTTGVVYTDWQGGLAGGAYGGLYAYYDKDTDEGMYLGSAGLNGSGTWAAARFGLSFDSSGNAYASYIDYAAGRNTTVAKWNGSSWTELGGRGAIPTATGTTFFISNLSVSPTTQQPYIAYLDTTESRLRAARWNWSSWVAVGSPILPATPTVGQLHFSIAPDGTPYVAYREGASPFKLYVQRFDGTNWSIVSGGAVSAWDIRQPTIAFASDSTPYVAYADVTNNFAVTVRKFDGTNWSTVGTPGIGVRAGNTSVSVASLAVSGTGVVYFSYSDYSTATSFPYTRIARFDGTNWVSLGGPIGRIITQPNLAISPTGQLHVGYRETSDHGGLSSPSYLSSVVKWNGTSWVTVGSADFAGNSTLSRLAFDPIRGIPYLLVTDENQKISVKSPVIVLGTATAVQMDISAGNVSVNSPTTVSFPGATASNALQTLNVSAGTFSVQDLKGASAGYYATISISDLTSGSKTIPKANVTATVSGGTVTKIAGYDNASVTVPTSGGTIWAGYVSLANATTLMARSSGGGLLGQYGASVSLRIGVPAYTPAGNYSGTITVTLIEN